MSQSINCFILVSSTSPEVHTVPGCANSKMETSVLYNTISTGSCMIMMIDWDAVTRTREGEILGYTCTVCTPSTDARHAVSSRSRPPQCIHKGGRITQYSSPILDFAIPCPPQIVNSLVSSRCCGSNPHTRCRWSQPASRFAQFRADGRKMNMTWTRVCCV